MVRTGNLKNERLARPQIPFNFTGFVKSRETRLKISEKLMSWTGDSFDIDDADTGNPVMYCQGKKVTLSQRKVISDVQGRGLLTLKQKHLALREGYRMFLGGDDKGQHICNIRKKFEFELGSKMIAELSNMNLVLEGNWRGKVAVIYQETSQGRTPIARMEREGNLKHYIGGAQTYFVTIMPGVDIPFIVAMIIAFDERKETAQTAQC